MSAGLRLQISIYLTQKRSPKRYSRSWRKQTNLARKLLYTAKSGIGRTGHVLAAWLVGSRGLSNKAAILAVRRTGRNPYEAAIVAAMKGRNPLKAIEELNVLLNSCRP